MNFGAMTNVIATEELRTLACCNRFGAQRPLLNLTRAALSVNDVFPGKTAKTLGDLA